MNLADQKQLIKDKINNLTEFNKVPIPAAVELDGLKDILQTLENCQVLQMYLIRKYKKDFLKKDTVTANIIAILEKTDKHNEDIINKEGK